VATKLEASRGVEKDSAGRDRINRVTYEVAVLETLREQLRCKEIWVVGARIVASPAM
jgi:hypothetical protein